MKLLIGEIVIVDHVGLFEMLQSLVTFIPFGVEMPEVHVDLSCLNVVRAKHFHATEK